MKKMMKDFCLRGLVAAGFGPIAYGIVILVIELCGVDTMQNGVVIFKAIISTYLMGFVCAGLSAIWQNERLGLGLAILIHGTSLYLLYLITYLVNGWILTKNILIFSIIFILGYLLVWLVIYLIEKVRAKKFNQQLMQNN